MYYGKSAALGLILSQEALKQLACQFRTVAILRFAGRLSEGNGQHVSVVDYLKKS